MFDIVERCPLSEFVSETRASQKTTNISGRIRSCNNRLNNPGCGLGLMRFVHERADSPRRERYSSKKQYLPWIF